MERLRSALAAPRGAGADVAGLASPCCVSEASRGVRVWAELPDKAAASSFGGASGVARIIWEGFDSSGSREVPLKVARAWGEAPVNLGSLAALEARLDELMRSCAWERLQTLVKARERSAQDVRQRLEDGGYPRDVASDAVERARRCQLVDDARFAASFVRAKARAGWGRQRVARELARLGVASDVANEAMGSQIAGVDEATRARAAIARRRIPETNPVPKLARFLAGRGFSSDVALSVAKSYVQDMNDQES